MCGNTRDPSLATLIRCPFHVLPTPRVTVANMAGYAPGEQPKPGEQVIKLNTNGTGIRRVEVAGRNSARGPTTPAPLPAADGGRLQEPSRRASTAFGPECVLAGNGNDDILRIALRTTARQATCSPVQTRRARSIPCSASLPMSASSRCRGVKGLESAHRRAACDAATPSILLRQSQRTVRHRCQLSTAISALAARTKCAGAGRQAYVDFAERNARTDIERHDNVLVSRTLQQRLWTRRSPVRLRHRTPVDHRPDDQGERQLQLRRCAIAAASAALDDQDYANCWARVREQRQRLTGELTARAFSVLPNQGNFVLATVPNAGDAGAWYRSLRNLETCWSRFFDKPGLRDKHASPSAHPNDALLAALDAARSTLLAQTAKAVRQSFVTVRFDLVRR